jgi:hypothetical protein
MKRFHVRHRVVALGAVVALLIAGVTTAAVIVVGPTQTQKTTGLAVAFAGNQQGRHGPAWGVIDRNTIGSPVAELRYGPYSSPGFGGTVSSPPLGTGSLGIEVANFGSGNASAEKVAYGNEVDFLGDPVSGLNQVGFHVFQTNENTQSPGAPGNMPNITLEIDPHVANKAYTSMVWNPDPIPASGTDQWSPYLDATKNAGWYFTNGAVASATHCSMATPCTLANAKAELASNNDGGGPATIDTVAIAKGRDYAWQGAVDGLRINDKVYDFEANGVFARDVTTNSESGG